MAWLRSLSLSLRRELPIVLQTEAAECGLACLTMIAVFHGHRIDLATLRRRFPASLNGTTLAAIIDVAQRLDLATRPVRAELQHLKQLRRPCILHWEFKHFVVLKRATSRHLIVHDPASGERKLDIGRASACFTGVALELWPDKSFRPQHETRPIRIRDLIGRVSGLLPSLSQALVLAAVLEIFTLLSPLFLQWVVDHVLVSGNRDLLTTLALGFGLLVTVQHSVVALRAWVIVHFGTTLNVQWHARTFSHLLTLPMQYFEKRHIGDIISRFRSIDAIQGTLTTAFIEAVMDGTMAAVMLIVLFLYSPLLTWLCLGAVALYVASRWIGYRPLRRATEDRIVHAAKQESHFLETVRGIRSIKLFQRQHERRAGWLTLMVDQVNAGLRGEKLHLAFRAVHGLVFGLENVAVVWLGATLVLDGRFSVGMLIAFMAYKRQFSSRVGTLVDRLVEVKMLQVQGARLADIVLEPPETSQASGRLAMSANGALEPTVELCAVRFKYAEYDPYVLDGVDLRVESGESVAIVGPSGCGKTTLLNLLLGILQPSDGSIAIGGTDVAHLGIEAMRRTIGCVTQNDMLFAGSVSDNISFFDSRADQEWVEECARLAAVHNEIVRMPMAYNTLVGYMGSALSGGQQQRILLARALYKRPRLLVLDEATSHLDIKREIMVNASIRALAVTRILVAHRPQTAESADRIVTLEQGKIVNETRIAPRHSGSMHASTLP
jgi:ATP-binding cassette subfamily B protein RaxB